MSDVEDSEDSEFLNAFEDELYNETWSVGSDDSLDSELEAELYQNVHFASSLVETPTNSLKEEKSPDSSHQSTGLESQVNETKNENEKSLDHILSSDDEEKLKENSSSLYPEVELVFSKDDKNKNLKRGTAAKFFQIDTSGENLTNDSSSDSNEWKLIEADLLPVPKKKMRNVRCFNCNERGHRTLECTEPKKRKMCWLCGELGHLRKHCPNEECYNCKAPGHQIKKCPKPRCHPEETCRRCHAHGHFESFCPDRWRQFHHTTKEGEIVKAMQPDFDRKNVFCYNCGDRGHLGHECLEETQGFFDPSFPFVVRYDRYTADVRSSPQKGRDKETRLPVNQNSQNSKSFQNKRKRASGDRGRKSGKRRKIGDGDDQTRDSIVDNCDQMETSTDFPSAKPVPPQPLMSLKLDAIQGKKKRKRKQKPSQEQHNQNQNETLEKVGKRKNNKPSQRLKKILKKQAVLTGVDYITLLNNVAKLPSPTQNEGASPGTMKNRRKRKRKRKNSNINMDKLAPKTNSLAQESSNVQVSNGDRRVVQLINSPQNGPENFSNQKPSNPGEKRKVYFKFNGFL